MKLSKWQALGNDYLLVEQAELTQPLTPGPRSAALRLPLRRRVGRAARDHGSVDGTRAEVRIWNPDGSTAELSGNGVRIVAALACAQVWCEAGGNLGRDHARSER